MWRQLLLFTVIFPAGLATAGFVIYKRYSVSAAGKISKIRARKNEAQKLRDDYTELLASKDIDWMTPEELQEIRSMKSQLDEYDRMIVKEL